MADVRLFFMDSVKRRVLRSGKQQIDHLGGFHAWFVQFIALAFEKKTQLCNTFKWNTDDLLLAEKTYH